MSLNCINIEELEEVKGLGKRIPRQGFLIVKALGTLQVKCNFSGVQTYSRDEDDVMVYSFSPVVKGEIVSIKGFQPQGMLMFDEETDNEDRV